MSYSIQNGRKQQSWFNDTHLCVCAVVCPKSDKDITQTSDISFNILRKYRWGVWKYHRFSRSGSVDLGLGAGLVLRTGEPPWLGLLTLLVRRVAVLLVMVEGLSVV